MFDKNIIINGKHAEYLKKYAKDKSLDDPYEFNVTDNNGKERKTQVFDTMIQEYMVACMIGIIENKQSPEDKPNGVIAHILSEQVSRNRINLTRIARMMFLIDEKKGVDERIKNAFSINWNETEVQKQMDAYARAGLEIINKEFSSVKTYEDAIYQINVLMEKYGIDGD